MEKGVKGPDMKKWTALAVLLIVTATACGGTEDEVVAGAITNASDTERYQLWSNGTVLALWRGHTVDGEWVDNGPATYWTSEGDVSRTGTYSNNKPVGTWHWWDGGRRSFDITFNDDGDPIQMTSYTLDGTTKTGPVAQRADSEELDPVVALFPLPHGTWKVWASDGTLLGEEHFEMGKLVE
jgi:hypothetical protein